MSSVILVFTAKDKDLILSRGGTDEWALNKSIAKDCEYVVCTRNTKADVLEHPELVSGPEAHGSAFLVGRIADVVKVNHWNGRDRYRIVFDAYAEANFPDVWKGWRNPVKYVTPDELGFNIASLEFHPLDQTALEESALPGHSVPEPAEAKPLTIAQAKQGLALTFGIDPSSIEITIRG